MGVPLDHDVRVVGQPNRTAFGQFAIAVFQQHFMPFGIGGRTGLVEAFGHAHGLHRVMFLEFPAQVVAGDELSQSGVERADVVVL